MLQEIDELVGTNFLHDMDMKGLPKSKPYTQKEAEEMSKILGQVYMISHAIHCKPCGRKYRT